MLGIITLSDVLQYVIGQIGIGEGVEPVEDTTQPSTPVPPPPTPSPAPIPSLPAEETPNMATPRPPIARPPGVQEPS